MQLAEAGVIKLGTALKEYIDHHLDLITDSDWFDELVTSKVNARIEKEIKELKLHHLLRMLIGLLLSLLCVFD